MKTLLLFILSTLSVLCMQAQYPFLNWAITTSASSPTASGLPRAITTDAAGNVYAAGSFYGIIDFDPGSAVYNMTASGKEMFVMSLDASGNFRWAKQFQPLGGDLSGITTDVNGNIYTLGISPIGDVIIIKLDALGNLLWSKNTSGGNNGLGLRIATDANSNVYAVGEFFSTTDFDPGAGTYNLTSAGSGDMFVMKLDASGNFVWANRMGSTGLDQADDIAITPGGDVLVTGFFNGTVDFDPGAGSYPMSSPTGSNCGFICKLSSAGNFIWANQHQGTGSVGWMNLGLDNAGNIYTSGNFFSTVDFDPGSGTYALTSAGNDDVFACKLDPSGNFLWANQVGGSLPDMPWGMNVDAFGNVCITGMFSNPVDFDPGSGTYILTGNTINAFAYKLGPNGSFIWAEALAQTSIGNSITSDASGAVYCLGSHSSTSDFDPGPATYNLSCTGGNDCIYIQKLQRPGDGGTVGLKENVASGLIRAYPNPAGTVLIVETTAAQQPLQVRLRNALGQVVLSVAITERQQALDLQALQSGLYILDISSGNNTLATQKIVKE